MFFFVFCVLVTGVAQLANCSRVRLVCFLGLPRKDGETFWPRVSTGCACASTHHADVSRCRPQGVLLGRWLFGSPVVFFRAAHHNGASL